MDEFYPLNRNGGTKCVGKPKVPAGVYSLSSAKNYYYCSLLRSCDRPRIAARLYDTAPCWPRCAHHNVRGWKATFFLFKIFSFTLRATRSTRAAKMKRGAE